MPTMLWKAALDAPDLPSLFRRVAALPAFRGALPRVRYDVEDFEPARGDDWLERTLAKTTIELFALWDQSFKHFIAYRPGEIVQFAIPDAPRDPAAALALLAPLPFEVASFDSIHPGWLPDYEGPRFGGFHLALGWGCAFRGDGHRRLVSRRWLEHGPWKLARGPHDTTLVQFHDLDADAALALAQARPGHAFMDEGYLHAHAQTETTFDGLYNATTQTMRIVVAGRDVAPGELRDACLVRAQGGSNQARPIRQFAYLFLDEATARRHVGELWLRELECWTLVAGKEVRIDLDYRPSDDHPVWTRA